MDASGAQAILAAVDVHLQHARAALEFEAEAAISEGQRILEEVDELLAQGVDDGAADVDTMQAMVGLRSELGGYLLAVTTLEEVGVSPGVVVSVLQRGTDQVDAMLGQIAVDAS
jgi:hypothetical protein